MASMEDIKVQLKQIDNRLVVEVIGKKVIVSKILEELSRAFNQNKNVEEVRIMATESIQVDADLKHDTWHGMNIAIQTNAIVVSKPVTWDVSGKSNDHIYPDNAGTDKDGEGMQGKDGYPGESGGNVLMLANRIENVENLTIISNGGKGSKGQDGGNGKNGENGKGITEREFKEMFPPTAFYSGKDRNKAVAKTIRTLSSDSHVVTQWAQKSFQTPITQDVLNEIHEDAYLSDIFIKVVNNEENEITFSFECDFPITQSFLLFKGAPGKPGGSGGVKGRGGQGGYAGEITVKNVTTNLQFPVSSFSNQGDEGESGRGGLFGNHGTNGNDMAYTDYAPSIFSSWPQYYGMDGISKLSLNFYDARTSDRIYCPHKNYIGSDYKYCSISASSNEQNANKKYQERNNSNRNDQKHHALATRKKPILENRLRASFSDYVNVIENTRKSAEMQRKSTISAVEVTTQTVTNATNKISEHSRSEVKMEHINLATTLSKPTVQTQQTYADINEKKSAQITSSNTTKTSTVEKSEAQMGNLKQNTLSSKVIIQKQEIHKSTLSAPRATIHNISQNIQQDAESKIQSSKQAELKAEYQTSQIRMDSVKTPAETISNHVTKTSTVEKSEAQMGNLKQDTSLSKVIIQNQPIHNSTLSGSSTQNVTENKQQVEEVKTHSAEKAELKIKLQTPQIASNTCEKNSTQLTSSNMTQQTAEPKLDITKQIALQCGPITVEKGQEQNVSKISEIVIATQNNVKEITKHQQDISESLVIVTELDVLQNTQETEAQQTEERLISDTIIEENQEAHLSNEQEQTIESNIKRHVQYAHGVELATPHKAIQLNAKLESNHGHFCPVDSLNIDFKKIQNWLILRRHLHSREDLQDLFKIFESNKTSFIESDSINQSVVLQLMIEKYRLATIEAINNQLPLYEDVLEDTRLTPEEACTYLTEDFTDDKGISHPVLGRLNPYIHENSQDQREKLFRYCCDDLKDNIDMVKQTFIIEIGHLEASPDCIKTIHDEYKIVETQRKCLNPELDEFERQLSQPQYANICRLWKKRNVDGSANQELEKQIQNDSFLKSLWEHLNDQYKIHYDWTKCYGDQNVFDCLCKHIKNSGFESKTYRELLALIFDINIRIYEKDFEDDLFLQENLNTTSKTVVYCLRLATGFIQLKINKNHFKLHQERQNKDAIYKKILTKIRTINHKQELDKMLSSKARWDDKSEEFCSVENIDPQLILEYFPQEERHELDIRLPKLRPEYIGQEEILYHLHNRFSSEGRHISCEEMYFFINCILSHCLEGGQEKYTFAWLIAAYPQCNWTDELVLLHLENHFKEQLTAKSKWREYLSKIQNKEVLMLLSGKLEQAKALTTDRMEAVLCLLSNINRGSVFLEELELSEWPYVLKEQYWLRKLEEVCNVRGDDDISFASYYVLSIENMYGTELVENLLKILHEKIREEGNGSNLFITILSYFHNGKWNLSDADLQKLKYVNFSEWMKWMNVKYNSSQNERNILQLIELITCNANSSELVKMKLPNIERLIIEINECKYEIKKNIVHNFISLGNVDYEPNTKMVHKLTESDIRIWAKYFSAREYKIDVGDLQEMLAVIDRAVVLKRGFSLRDTQKLAILALLANDRSILAQISTGEGKSLIVVAAAIMKALFREKVDIVTSSSVLAKRDAENNNDIYSLFGITVSHNCSEETEKRREAYVLCQVVYGDLGSFQRDYLLDRFYGKNILGDRDLSNVIVDEVDSMLVDKGNNMLYLSHDIPWMDKLESVYLFIWQQINSLEQFGNETDDDVKYIEEAVLNDLYGMIRLEDIAKIDVNLSDRDLKVIWSRILNAKVIDTRGRLLIGSIDGLKISNSLAPEFSRYTDRITFLLQATIERERLILIPNYLRSFVERHLKQWINSAINAFFMNPGYNYVVDVDRTGTSSDRNANIIILDKDTGTDQANSQWDEALHQFLQLKHGCKLSMLSLKAVFISNVSYFQLYRQLYGLTGTLGSETERDLLREIHNVDFVTIPTSRAKQFDEELPIVCCEREEWINSVCKKVHFVTDEQKRSVLVICETVKDADDLTKVLRGKGEKNVHRYVRDYDPFTVLKEGKKLDQGQVIIATNLAGRGTDIQITDALKNVGGLHVLLTYLPGNKRIEEQAFGRAARSGDKGSGQLIIIHSKGMDYSNAKVLGLKKERDIEEALRVSEINSFYKTQIIAEESCFNKFNDLYKRKRKELKDAKVPDEVIKILLTSCLDKWAYWLDEQNKNIILSQGDSLKNQFKESLDQFMSMLHDLSPGTADTRLHDYDTSAWIPWVDGNPAQMIELAKLLCQKSYWRSFSLGYHLRYDNSLMLLDKVIQTEPQFSEAAHYYKAFAISMNDGTTDKSAKRRIKQELRAAAKLFEEHSKFVTSASAIIDYLKNNRDESDRKCRGYEEQKENLLKLYSTFIRSIDDILGKTVTPQSFENHEINDQLAEYIVQDLFQHGILKTMKLKTKNISTAKLKKVLKDLSCTVSVKKLEEFLSSYGTNVNEKEFVKAFKKAIELPEREQFWKILTQQKAFQDVVSYVIVNQERMKAIDPSLMDFIKGRTNDNTLKKQTMVCTDNQIMLYVECIVNQAKKEIISKETQDETLDDELVFVKEEFVAFVGKKKYNFFKENRVLSFNKKATINGANLEKVVFPCFDSICINDFIEKTSITGSEGEIILSDLVKANVLRKHSEPNQHTYELIINFDEMPPDQIFSCTAYEPVVYELLEACFSYRLAIEKLKQQLIENTLPIRLDLKPQLHQNLIFHLMDQKIISPGKVMNGKIEEIYRTCHRNHYTMTELQRLMSVDGIAPSNKKEVFERLLKYKWISGKLNPLILFFPGSFWMLPANAVPSNKMYKSESQANVDLKSKINLPSREEFWDVMIQTNVLYDVKNYVAVDQKRLKAIDPSMIALIQNKIDQKELNKQILTCTNQQIILYEQNILNANVPDQANRKSTDLVNEPLVFSKDNFITIVSREKYITLKAEGALCCNRKANINPTLLNGVVFPNFDSISIKDFTEKTTINENDAEKILSELVERKILQKPQESDSHSYSLAINFDDIPKNNFISSISYEPVVRQLLEACFSYRIAIQKIKRQLDENTNPIRLELVPRLHQSFMLDLLDQKTTSMVCSESREKSDIGHSEAKLEMLCHVTDYNNIEKETQETTVDNVLSLDILNLYQYNISKATTRRTPLEVFLSVGQEESMRFYNSDETVAKQFDYKLKLTEDNVLKHVSKTLTALRGSLKEKNVPQLTLTSLSDIFGKRNGGNAEEIRVFLVNGLDKLINVEEKKWTAKMRLNTFTVVAIGMAQIAIGAIIELYYAGFMAHVGAAFINEGVNDLMYAVGALKSGYFSWQEYRKHKIQSVAIAGATVGVAGFLSKGVKVSRYGRKLAQAGYTGEGGIGVANASGKQLIKSVGCKTASKEVAKRIALKSAEAIVFGMKNSIADTTLENYLKNMCDKIGNTFIEKTIKAVDDHNISHRLKEVYNTLGVDKAKQMMEEITNSAFSERNIFETYGPEANKFQAAVVQGFTQGIAKQSKVGIDSGIPIATICKAASFLDKAMEIGNITIFTYKFLDNIDQQIEIKLKKLKDEKKQDNQLEVNEMDQEYIEFRDAIIDQWKSLLSQRVGNVISQQIIAPIIKHCSAAIVKLGRDVLKKGYRTLKDYKDKNEFNKAKDAYNKDSHEKTNEQTKEYHDKLLKLFRKTRNPAVVAAIIRENIPMDFTCVQACAFVLPRVFKSLGVNVEGLALKVVGENGMEQTFCSASNEKIQQTITLTLKDNHFTSCIGGSQDQPSSTDTGVNDCLFAALTHHFPELQTLGAKQFREMIAQSVMDEPELKHHIRKGYHNLPIKQGAYGGRSRTAEIEPTEIEPDCDFPQYKYIDKAVYNHFIKRFKTLLLLASLLQEYATETGFKADELIECGTSKYQDRVCKNNKRYVQAHLIQAGRINRDFELKYPEKAKKLKNMLGRTETMQRWANVSRGIGGDFDKIQRTYLPKLLAVDFSKPLTKEGEAILKSYTQGPIDAYNKRIKPIQKFGNKNKLVNTGHNIKQTKLETFTALQETFTNYTPAYLHEHVRMSKEKLTKY